LTLGIILEYDRRYSTHLFTVANDARHSQKNRGFVERSGQQEKGKEEEEEQEQEQEKEKE
jgi:hypothetical protein